MRVQKYTKSKRPEYFSVTYDENYFNFQFWMDRFWNHFYIESIQEIQTHILSHNESEYSFSGRR